MDYSTPLPLLDHQQAWSRTPSLGREARDNSQRSRALHHLRAYALPRGARAPHTARRLLTDQLVIAARLRLIFLFLFCLA